jgi:hypothetical protein
MLHYYVSGWRQGAITQLTAENTNQPAAVETGLTPAPEPNGPQTNAAVPSTYAIRRLYYTIIRQYSPIIAFFLAFFSMPENAGMKELQNAVKTLVRKGEDVSLDANPESVWVDANPESVLPGTNLKYIVKPFEIERSTQVSIHRYLGCFAAIF